MSTRDKFRDNNPFLADPKWYAIARDAAYEVLCDLMADKTLGAQLNPPGYDKVLERHPLMPPSSSWDEAITSQDPFYVAALRYATTEAIDSYRAFRFKDLDELVGMAEQLDASTLEQCIENCQQPSPRAMISSDPQFIQARDRVRLAHHHDSAHPAPSTTSVEDGRSALATETQRALDRVVMRQQAGHKALIVLNALRDRLVDTHADTRATTANGPAPSSPDPQPWFGLRPAPPRMASAAPSNPPPAGKASPAPARSVPVLGAPPGPDMDGRSP